MWLVFVAMLSAVTLSFKQIQSDFIFMFHILFALSVSSRQLGPILKHIIYVVVAVLAMNKQKGWMFDILLSSVDSNDQPTCWMFGIVQFSVDSTPSKMNTGILLSLVHSNDQQTYCMYNGILLSSVDSNGQPKGTLVYWPTNIMALCYLY